MRIDRVWEDLVRPEGKKIVYLILDGLGGLPDPERGETELQAAYTPNLDHLAEESSCGLLETAGPGITPGSGPGHLALFGYDPFEYTLGRGILAALGIEFPLREGDVAARLNFASVDSQGNITDRRAGRIDDKTNRRLCDKILKNIEPELGSRIVLQAVSQHRAVLILRSDDLGHRITDTDPQRTGVPPSAPVAKDEASQKTLGLVNSFLAQTKRILADETKANAVLLRGFDGYRPIPSLEERFGLRGLAVAKYPMYRGLSGFLGMDVASPPRDLEDAFEQFQKVYLQQREAGFFFFHIKDTDSSGEDGNFLLKVRLLEKIDVLMPLLANVVEDVLIITSDHSTPAIMGQHSWHPVPVLIRSEYARRDSVNAFNEIDCLQGSLGIRPALHLMGLALAHAGRLKKYGA